VISAKWRCNVLIRNVVGMAHALPDRVLVSVVSVELHVQQLPLSVAHVPPAVNVTANRANAYVEGRHAQRNRQVVPRVGLVEKREMVQVAATS
jgi:hypothetical protein